MDFGISKSEKFTFLIVLVALATSGFVPFMSMRYLLILLLPLIWSRMEKKRIALTQKGKLAILIIFIFHLFNFIFEHLTFWGFLVASLFYTSIVVAIHLIGNNFIRCYTKLMCLFAFISIVFWGIIIVSPSIHSTLLSLDSVLPQNISDDWLERTTNPGTHLYIVYVASKIVDGVYRNPGPFYEPGLFASFLSLALIFNIGRERTLFTKQNLILFCALLTTFSSAGYVQMVLIILYYVMTRDSTLWKIVLIIVCPFIISAVYQLDFMGEKIVTNYGDATINTYSRFGAMIYHWEKICESPIIGYGGGLIPHTRLDDIMQQGLGDYTVSPNGITWVFVYWGIPLGLLFYVLLYNSIKIIVPKVKKKWEYLMIFFIIIAAAFSQTITTMPIFIFILFSFIPQLQKNENRYCKYL